MKVLCVHPSNERYGSDRSFARSVRALSSPEFDVTVVLPTRGPLDDLAGSGRTVHWQAFPVLRRGSGSAPRQVVILLRVILALRTPLRILRRARPAVVYVNTVICPQWIIAARILGIPVVCHVRELESDPNRLAQRALLFGPARSSHVVANSRATATWIAEVVPQVAARTSVVYNGIEAGPASPGRTASALRLVVVGRLSHRKGQLVAIAALALLHRTDRPVELHLVGAVHPTNEEFLGVLREAAERHGVAANVFFDGETDHPAAAFAAADLVLVPSLQEPFGNVAVEAALAERPVIASAVEGLAEAVEDGRSGFLVPPSDARSLADAVEVLASDAERARAMGMYGRTRALTRFSVAAYEAAIRETVRSVGLGSGRASARKQA